MKTVQIGKSPDGYYLVVDARAAPSDSASIAPCFAAHSEQQLRSILQRFGFTPDVIDKAVLEVNRAGEASIPLGA
jgi:hypothetical protein